MAAEAEGQTNLRLEGGTQAGNHTKPHSGSRLPGLPESRPFLLTAQSRDLIPWVPGGQAAGSDPWGVRGHLLGGTAERRCWDTGHSPGGEAFSPHSFLPFVGG